MNKVLANKFFKSLFVLTLFFLTIAFVVYFESIQINASTIFPSNDAANATGVLSVSNGGTGAATLTGYVKGTGTSALTASATIPTSSLTGVLAIANGGTNSSTASGARTQLGVAIGTDVQAYDAELAAIAGLTSASNTVPYFTGSGTAAVTSFTSNGRRLVDQTSSANMRTALVLGNVENTAISTWAGSTNLTTLGTIGTLTAITPTVSITNGLIVNTNTIYARNNGNVGIGTTAPSRALDVNGRAKILSIESPISTLTDASTIALNLGAANNFKVVLGGNRTLGVPINAAQGQTGVITVRQDSTGSRTLAYAWPYIFVGGAAPTLSTGKFVMDQLSYIVNSVASANVTVTIATPGVMTWTAHGLVSGQRIQLSTTGALPTGLSAATSYWVNVVDANTFNLSTSLANLQTATYIATSGSQSGTHTALNEAITVVCNPAIN